MGSAIRLRLDRPLLTKHLQLQGQPEAPDQNLGCGSAAFQPKQDVGAHGSAQGGDHAGAAKDRFFGQEDDGDQVGDAARRREGDEQLEQSLGVVVARRDIPEVAIKPDLFDQSNHPCVGFSVEV